MEAELDSLEKEDVLEKVMYSRWAELCAGDEVRSRNQEVSYLFVQLANDTDHKPCMAILGPKKGHSALAAAQLQHWAIMLTAYSTRLSFD